MKKTLCTLVASLAIGLAGCGTSTTNTQPNYQTIKGTPISVDGEFGQSVGVFSTVVDVEGKKVLCTANPSKLTKTYLIEISQAVSLIQSEINDNDEESVDLTGAYKGNVFEINSVTANGYTINLK